MDEVKNIEKRDFGSVFLLPVRREVFCLCNFRMGCAHVAQLVERILGKDEVSSSNLLMGSI